ncbi:MAG: type II toxin-antitoxin system VapC family toxin [Caulobacterales bacterium]|jgi:ribonuclease VapC|nr:type II toxin-antitoxin system VapC family toxin [Caulobacterales bacterium]
MIVLDTSAIIALLNAEPEALAMEAALAADKDRCISAASLVETTMVASRWGDLAATAGIDALLAALEIEVAPFDVAQLALARQAFLKFGKGRGHPAQLNICDCFSYALAKSRDAPLLFKGKDFPHTDITAAA